MNTAGNPIANALRQTGVAISGTTREGLTIFSEISCREVMGRFTAKPSVNSLNYMSAWCLESKLAQLLTIRKHDKMLAVNELARVSSDLIAPKVHPV